MVTWKRIKHKRKFKSYLLNLANKVEKPNKQTNLLKIVSDPSTHVEFYASPSKDNDCTLIILAWVKDHNLFAIHGFEFEDSIQKIRNSGKGYYKNFITVFDLFDKADSIPELPELVQAFWEDLLND